MKHVAAKDAGRRRLSLTAVLDVGDGGGRGEKEEEEEAGGGGGAEEAVLGRHGRRVGLGELEDSVRRETGFGWIYKTFIKWRENKGLDRVTYSTTSGGLCMSVVLLLAWSFRTG